MQLCKTARYISSENDFFPLGVPAIFNHSKYKEQRHLAANYLGVLSALYIDLIKKILYNINHI